MVMRSRAKIATQAKTSRGTNSKSLQPACLSSTDRNGAGKESDEEPKTVVGLAGHPWRRYVMRWPRRTDARSLIQFSAIWRIPRCLARILSQLRPAWNRQTVDIRTAGRVDETDHRSNAYGRHSVAGISTF